MKSMDTVRFVPGSDYSEECSFVKGERIIWKCNNGHVNRCITGPEFEDYIVSESRDPDVDYLKCRVCGCTKDVSNSSVEATLYDGFYPSIGRIVSDGFFVYHVSDTKVRIC